MIHYDLRCGDGHLFDGWFRSSAAFEQQSESGLLDCPVCASSVVTRALMAPRLNRGALAPPAPESATPNTTTPQMGKPENAAKPEQDVSAAPTVAVSGPPAMPDQMRAVLQRIRAEIEQKCEYVGPRFAEQARAMHRGDQEQRSIYGETTPDQAEALADDGIDVARIPWVPRADG